MYMNYFDIQSGGFPDNHTFEKLEAMIREVAPTGP
jgi:hypothetical protein